jgi:hypothetical protein
LVSTVSISLGYPIIGALAIHPETGLFYAATLRDHYTIDPVTGITNLIGSTGFGNIRGLDFADDNTSPIPNPVPEPSTVLLLGSALIGVIGLRKKLRK